jgi:nanoRNase/pAp phosphatase (c-di-AMP/oligoRNAs hydrolase)
MMVSDTGFQKAVELMDKSKRILTETHTKPDGDACGCLAAIADVLAGLDAGHSNQ